MLFGLCAFVSARSVFLGNWTNVDNITLTMNRPPRFQVTMNISNETTPTRTIYDGIFFTRNTSQGIIDMKRRQSLYGFADESNVTFFFFGVDGFQPEDVDAVVKSVSDEILAYTNFTESEELVLEMFANVTQGYTIEEELLTLFWTVKPGQLSDDPYALPVEIEGHAAQGVVSGEFSGYEFNMAEFIVQGKIFGLVMSVAMIVEMYAWSSLSKGHSVATYEQMSLTALIMHMSFDFCIGLYVLDIGLAYSFVRGVCILVFIGTLCMYFWFQMLLILQVWRIGTDIMDQDAVEVRRQLVVYFGKMSVLMFMSLFCVLAMTDFPIVALPYLCSSLLPQILHSATRSTRKTVDTKFTILLTINRIMIVYYVFIYRMNFMESHAEVTATICIVWSILQMCVVIIQNKFGGNVFTPRRWRAIDFNYFQVPVEPGMECSICMTNIEEGDATMMTPCLHGFHADCLARWMQEQMICPICRARLPSYNNLIQ